MNHVLICVVNAWREGKSMQTMGYFLLTNYIMKHHPQKLAKHLLNAFMKSTDNVKGVTENAGASKADFDETL